MEEELMNAMILLIYYFLFVNLTGLFSMYLDKERAKKRAFRIPEATLFTIAIIGGSVGSLVGMYLFRHKTRHWTFVIGMPAILFLQLAVLVLLYLSPLEIKFL